MTLHDLEWNTLENMVLRWNGVFKQFGIGEKVVGRYLSVRTYIEREVGVL